MTEGSSYFCALPEEVVILGRVRERILRILKDQRVVMGGRWHCRARDPGRYSRDDMMVVGD